MEASVDLSSPQHCHQQQDTSSNSIIDAKATDNPPGIVEVAMEVIDTTTMKVIDSSISRDSQGLVGEGEDVAETREEAEGDGEVVMEPTEYAISQVFTDEDPSGSMESSGGVPPPEVKSASVTLFDPLQRDSIIAYAEQTTISQASRRFKVPTTTIKKWINSGPADSTYTRAKYNSPGQGRKLSYSQEKDDRIATHIRAKVANGEKFSLQYVCNYAKSIIQEENPQFVASTGWAQRFLIRHCIDIGVPRPQKYTSAGRTPKRKSIPEANRGRPLSYSSATDRAIADYVKQKLSEGYHMTNSELRKYAKEIISKENPNFTGSASWAQNFLQRHKIALQSVSGMPMPVSGSSSPQASSPQVSLVSSTTTSTSRMISMSPSLSDTSLVAAEITPASAPPIYGDASIPIEHVTAEDPMKTALALLTGENVDVTMLSTAQVAALLTSDAVSLVDLLNSTQQAQEAGAGEEGGAALMASGLESPSSGNVYLNLGDGEGFGTGLTGAAATHVDPNTQTPVPTAGHIPEVVAQGSRPLSYAKETDQALASWVQSQQAEGKKVTFASLRAYAKQLVANENPNFTASVGWVTPFLLRHNLDLNINKKLKASRKGTPRRMSTKGSQEEEEEGESSGEMSGETAVEVEESGGPGLGEESSEEPFQENAITRQVVAAAAATITPEVLASAIANTFAEAVLNQQKEMAKESQEATGQEQTLSVGGSADAQHADIQACDNPYIEVLPVHSDVPASGGEQAVVSEEVKKKRTPTPREKMRARHTLAEKLEVVQLMKEHGMAAHYVCRMLGIANSTYAGWTKLVQQKGPELQALSSNKKRANVSGQGRPLSYSREKDEQIAQWVRMQKEMGEMVTPAELAKHATFVISQENPNFTASSGWQQKFLQRHNIQLVSSWGQKTFPGTSVTSSAEDKSVSVIPVPEEAQNIPNAVQTEEVTSNTICSGHSSKPYSDELDMELVTWVRGKQAAQETVTVQALCKMAEEVVSRELPSFTATLGWAFKFLHHHQIMLDPKPNFTTIMDGGSRKRHSVDRNTSPEHSKYLHTPKRARQMEPSPELAISPSTGNLCEALLALSNQTTGEGGGEAAATQALQAAMQNLQTMMQQALQQQIQQQQQQLGEVQQSEPKEQSLPKDPLPQAQIPTTPPIIRSMASSSSSTKKHESSGSGSGTPCNNYFGKPAREFTAEEKEEVVRYANATTLLKAALKYGVAAPTVWRWRVELKLHQPKYTAMQKKYIIKFAETNSLKEASQRYGITSKTIQNWRRGLQAEGELSTAAAAGSSEDNHTPSGHSADQMLEAPSGLPRVAGDTEVVTYDSQNFQFIVDGGEVTDTSGRGDVGVVPMRVDPVPLEVTNEVDIENVGMEYDVISSEGHAAKPRCTAHEKMQILQYAIEHSVREASQKYGISPGTLYYWKKTSMGGSQSNANTSLSSLSYSGGERPSMMSIYPGNPILERLRGKAAGGGGGGGGRGGVVGSAGGGSDAIQPVKDTQEYLTSSEDATTSSLPGGDVNFLQAVSSLLNSAESAARAGGNRAGGEDLTPRGLRHSKRNNSNSGGISSPTEVLVTPLQVASEEMTTTEICPEDLHMEESKSTTLAEGGGEEATEDKVLENVVVVEVEPQGGVSFSDGNLEVARLVITETATAEEVEQAVQQELQMEGVEQEVQQGLGVEEGLRMEGMEQEVEQEVGQVEQEVQQEQEVIEELHSMNA